MAVGVLALQGDVREHVHALSAIGESATRVRNITQLTEVDALIIPGGESTTIINLLHVFGMVDQLRTLLAGGMPVWGTCAGMIVLAQEVLDPRPDPLRLIDISVRRNAYGRQTASFEALLEVNEFGLPPFRGVFIRAPVVERVGAGVQVIATLSDGSPVAVRQGSMLATSFHPELTQDYRFHRFFCDLGTRRDGLAGGTVHGFRDGTTQIRGR